jgi:MoaA/NifB/PqqE/SkfB family radical SAM enzyme
MNDLSEKREMFSNIKNISNRESRAKRVRNNPEFSTLLPEELRIQLTTNCNLRCKHCFQWSKNGYFRKQNTLRIRKQELPFPLLEKLLQQTKEVKSPIYIWGGEPLVYSNWDKLTSLLENDCRQKIISTNGIFINEKIDSINKISENLEVVFSIDGLMLEHDNLRGKGMFNKTVSNLKSLIREKEEGRYKGRITINCSIHNEMVKNLYEFVEFCNYFNINKLILGFPWYINKKVCKEMDDYYQKKLQLD